MRILYDARLPRGLEVEARGAVSLVRWTGDMVTDVELVQTAADEQFDGVLFLDRDSLAQYDVQLTANSLGMALIAVEAGSPFEAKRRVLNNIMRLRRALARHDCLLILAAEVRPVEQLRGRDDASAAIIAEPRDWREA
ncbi:hypothetical protein [Candidatus Poriferisodalis sp.]|uniref:hypothetical protein n=1 Tax=Candidatus Poriferisodalis sp. TaxID=3101277 RepID=UPI003B01013C